MSSVVSSAVLAGSRRAVLRRRIRLLVAMTITYNVVEAVVAITAGTIASSIALVGFGLDSVIEVSSAAAVAWQFASPDHQRREKAALRVIAGSLFVLAGYVTVEAVRTLIGGDEPERSPAGIVLVAVSVLVMPLLSWAQRRAGRELGSASAVADSRQTLLCTYLSAAVLVGLVLNAALGWWWADPVVALGLAAVAVREGRAALHGDTCCTPVHLHTYVATVDHAAAASRTATRTTAGARPTAPVRAARDGPVSTESSSIGSSSTVRWAWAALDLPPQTVGRDEDVEDRARVTGAKHP